MTARLVIPVLLLAAGGCMSHNPGYFPYYCLPGRTTEEHAKPAFGYFKNFDPKASKLDVTPSQATAPLGSSIVLVATVRDDEGNARRSRRVEWIVEGPGNIVEVDESGFYTGRGRKVDNKYAIGYTNYSQRVITRGNDDPRDDVTIHPGQTFCVVTSAVPGETTITAYAPGVFNWDSGRVVTKLVWGEGRFRFPAAAVVRAGGEHTLTTLINRFENDEPLPANFRVRYRILDGDGTPALLVTRNASLTGVGLKEAEETTDDSGAAAVRLVQSSPQLGKTRVAVEVVKPSDGGGPGVVVGRRETLIEWAAPKVELQVTAPPIAPASGTVPVVVTLSNTSDVDCQNSRVRVIFSDGATMAKSDPPPSTSDTAGIVWEVPPVPGKGRRSINLQVKPGRTGPFTVAAEVVTADNLTARNRAVVRAEEGRLQAVVDAPAAALANESIPFKVAVTNPGAAPAENVTVWATFDAGLTHPSGQARVELTAGTLAPGETKTLDLPLTASKTGRYTVRATATADGNLTAAAEPAAVDVRRAELKVAVAGPRMAYVGQEFTWTVAVGNPGDAAVSNVVVRATLPPEVKLKDAGEGKIGAGSVEWKIAEVKPGDQKTLTLKLEGARRADRATLTVAALGDATTNPAARGDSVEARGEGAVAVVGTPALVLEVTAPPGAVEVGKQAVFKIVVRNQGTLAADGVEVTAFVPPELKAVRALGAKDARIDASGKVTFPALDELRPGETATFTVEADAAQAGDARFRAEVRSKHLRSPLKEEQSTRVTGGR